MATNCEHLDYVVLSPTSLYASNNIKPNGLLLGSYLKQLIKIGGSPLFEEFAEREATGDEDGAN